MSTNKTEKTPDMTKITAALIEHDELRNAVEAADRENLARKVKMAELSKIVYDELPEDNKSITFKKTQLVAVKRKQKGSKDDTDASHYMKRLEPKTSGFVIE